MRAFARNLLLVASLSLWAPALATDGIYLPQAPRGSGGDDTIQSATGTRCSQSMNANGAYLDFGVVGRAGSSLPEENRAFISDPRDEEAVAYARVTLPLGRQPKRLDCSRLYELEIERLRRELDLLEINAE